MKNLTRFFLFVWIANICALEGKACSLFSFRSEQGQFLIGHNYDWYRSEAVAVINKRGVSKTGLLAPFDREKVQTWVSKYASLTINQFEINHPTFGINEKSLYIGIAWLDEAQSIDSEKPALNEAQIAQYLLDTTADVEEALSAVQQIHVKKVFAPVHYLLCDTKTCGILEFFNGKASTYIPIEQQVVGLTNNTIDDGKIASSKENFLTPTEEIYKSSESIDRFQLGHALGLKLLKERNHAIEKEDVFAIMKKLAYGYTFDPPEDGKPTEMFNRWRTVLEPTKQSITIGVFPRIEETTEINLRDFDLDCTRNTTYEFASVEELSSGTSKGFSPPRSSRVSHLFENAFELPLVSGTKVRAQIWLLQQKLKQNRNSMRCKTQK